MNDPVFITLSSVFTCWTIKQVENSHRFHRRAESL